jgi:ABC-2 type transport system ATP-binding protein
LGFSLIVPADQTMHNAISIRNLSKTYRVPSVFPWRKSRRVPALSHVHFDCPSEKITCLLGPNGAGKTTIIKILAAIVLPEEGDATILGESVSQNSIALRRKIGLLTPNERSFYWRLTGRQNLDFFASLYGIKGNDKQERIAEVLFRVGLEADANKPFRLYSSGMKQRLSLARALLPDPRIFLFDEPTTHLDPRAREEIHRLIKNVIVQESRATVLICTHDLAEAQKLADHIVLLDKGNVLAEGPMQALRRKLHSGYRVVLEFQRFPGPDWLQGIGVMDVIETENGAEMTIRDLSDVPDIVNAAVHSGGRVAKCSHKEESLEEIFTKLTGMES